MEYYTAMNNLHYRSNLYKVQTQRKQTKSTGLGQWLLGYYGGRGSVLEWEQGSPWDSGNARSWSGHCLNGCVHSTFHLLPVATDQYSWVLGNTLGLVT